MMNTLIEKYKQNPTSYSQYSDFNTNLDTHPGKKDLLQISNAAAIKKSVINLLKTNYFDRPYQPKLGANLSYLLFENTSEDTLMAIRDQIKYCIQVFEPRVDILSMKVAYTPDEQGVVVNMVVYIKNIATNSPIDFILSRVR